MVRELIGILIGIYITQNYTVPDIKEAFKDLQQYLEGFEKAPPKKKDWSSNRPVPAVLGIYNYTYHTGTTPQK